MSAIEAPNAPKSNTGKIVGCIGCGCLTAVLAVVAIVAFSFMGIRKLALDSEAYKESIAAIEASPAASEALGAPIEPGFMIQSSYSINNGDETIDMTVPLSGPNGKGSLRVVGSKSSGAPNWSYTTRELQIEGGETIQLGQ